MGRVGKAPIAPGTVATVAVGLPCACLLGLCSRSAAFFLLCAVIGTSCYIAGRAERVLEKHDPGEIVIDEVAGYLVTVFGFPLSVKPLLLGILLFRLFDIWKPWPIRLIDKRVKGGVGTVMDDVLAGVFGYVCLWLVIRYSLL